MGATRAGLSSESERHVDAGGPGAAGKRDWREDADSAAAGCNAGARSELLVRSADAGFEKGRVAPLAVQGKASAGKIEAHRIGAADVGGNTPREIPIDRAKGSGEIAEDGQGRQGNQAFLKFVRLDSSRRENLA